MSTLDVNKYMQNTLLAPSEPEKFVEAVCWIKYTSSGVRSAVRMSTLMRRDRTSGCASHG